MSVLQEARSLDVETTGKAASGRRLLKDFTITTVARMSSQFAGLALMAIFISCGDIVGYGMYLQSTGLTTLLTSVGMARIPFALVRFFPRRRSDGGGLLVAGGMMLVLILVCVWCAALLVGDVVAHWVYKDGRLTPLLYFALLAASEQVVYEWICVPLRSESRFVLTSIMDIAERMLLLACVIALLLAKRLTVQNLMIATCIIGFAKLAIVGRECLAKIEWRWPERRTFTMLLAFCLPLLPFLGGCRVIDMGLQYCVLHRFGLAGVGVLGTAITVTSLCRLFAGPLQTVLLPRLTNAVQPGDHATTRHLLLVAVRVGTCACTLGGIASICAMAPLFRLLGTDRPSPPVILMVVLGIAGVVEMLRQIVINVIHLQLKTRVLTRITMVSVCASILVYVVYPQWLGLTGAACGMLVGLLVQTLMIGSQIERSLLPIPTLRHVAVLILAGSPLAAVGMLNSYGVLADWVAMGSLAVGSVGFIVIFAVLGLNAWERRRLFELLYEKFSTKAAKLEARGLARP